MDDQTKTKAPKNTSSNLNETKKNQAQWGGGTIAGLAGLGFLGSKLILGLFSPGIQTPNHPFVPHPENPSVAAPYSQPYPEPSLETEVRLREQQHRQNLELQGQRLRAEQSSQLMNNQYQHYGETWSDLLVQPVSPTQDNDVHCTTSVKPDILSGGQKIETDCD